MEEALTTRRRVLGAGHRDTRCAASGLALAHSELGNAAEAAEVRALYNCE